jgi:hypothetical protein
MEVADRTKSAVGQKATLPQLSGMSALLPEPAVAYLGLHALPTLPNRRGPPRRTDRRVQPALHHADAGQRDRARRTQRPALLGRADGSRLVQADQRRLWPSGRRRSLENFRHHHVRQYPQRRPHRPLRRRGVFADTARIIRACCHAGARAPARHHRRTRLERIHAAWHDGQRVSVSNDRWWL